MCLEFLGYVRADQYGQPAAPVPKDGRELAPDTNGPTRNWRKGSREPERGWYLQDTVEDVAKPMFTGCRLAGGGQGVTMQSTQGNARFRATGETLDPR